MPRSFATIPTAVAVAPDFNSRLSPASLSIRPIVRRITVYSAFVLSLIALFPPPLIGADASTSPPNPRHTGTSAFRIWRTEEITGHPISREVVVHPETGYVFVANTGGVLMFDGVRWRLIPLPEEQRSRELAIDNAGRVWAAGTSEVVVLISPDIDSGESPTALVTHHIHDLFHSRHPRSDSDGESAPPPDITIRHNSYPSVMNTPQGMTVRVSKRVMLFGPEGLKHSWDLPGLFNPTDITGRPWWSEGALHVFREDHGVHRLDPGKTSKLPIDQIPAVLSTTARAGGGTLWLTTEVVGLPKLDHLNS